MTPRPTFGIPYAKAGVLSNDLEGLLSRLIDAWTGDGVNEPVRDADHFIGTWARTILTELKVTDAYYVTCPECGKRIYGAGRTEDEVTKGAGIKYARHYAWHHTRERLGSNLSALVIEDQP